MTSVLCLSARPLISPMTSRNHSSRDFRPTDLVELRCRAHEVRASSGTPPLRYREAHDAVVHVGVCRTRPNPRASARRSSMRAGSRTSWAGRRAIAPGRAALLHEHHAVAGGFHLAEQMRIRNTVVPRSRSSSMTLAHQEPSERIEPGGRLVEEHELRLVEQRLRESDALHHALAVGLSWRSAASIDRPGRAAIARARARRPHPKSRPCRRSSSRPVRHS